MKYRLDLDIVVNSKKVLDFPDKAYDFASDLTSKLGAETALLLQNLLDAIKTGDVDGIVVSLENRTFTNISIGRDALGCLTTGSGNIALGDGALSDVTTEKNLLEISY